MAILNSKYIRELIRGKGMTVADLAYRLGVSPDLMRRLLEKQEAEAEFTARMADTLGLTITEITAAR